MYVRLAAWAATLCFAQAALSASSSSNLRQERADRLDYIASGKAPSELVSKARKQCAAGESPKAIAWKRSLGDEAAPDAADDCMTILARSGHEGLLLTLYRDVSNELTGRPDGHEHLPAAIGRATKAGSAQVPLANGQSAVITPSLSLDAGFTVAYGKAQAVTASMPSLDALKPVAERCLAKTETNLSLCFATGYVYGARAVSGEPLAKP